MIRVLNSTVIGFRQKFYTVEEGSGIQIDLGIDMKGEISSLSDEAKTLIYTGFMGDVTTFPSFSREFY